jgi:hypothetical protein
MSYWIPIPGMMKGIRVKMVPISKKKRNRKMKEKRKNRKKTREEEIYKEAFNKGWDVGYDFATNPDKEDLRKLVDKLEKGIKNDDCIP